MSALSKQQAQEDTRWEGVIREGNRQKGLLQAYAEAYFVYEQKSGLFGGSWLTENNQSIKIIEGYGRITAEWGAGASRRKLEGSIVNYSAQVTLKKWQPFMIGNEDRGSYDIGKYGLAYVTKDGKELHHFTIEKANPDFINLKLVQHELLEVASD